MGIVLPTKTKRQLLAVFKNRINHLDFQFHVLMLFILQKNLYELVKALRRLILIYCNPFHEIPPHSFSPIHHLVGFEPSHSFPNQPSQLLLQQYPGPFVGLDKKSRYDVTTVFFLQNFSLNAKKIENHIE